MRLGIALVDGRPAAAQLWIVHHHKASIYKLAYDEAFGELSVGTLLSCRLFRHVLEIDRVTEIDYLAGDEPYKSDWMTHRRERWGMHIMNRATLHGLLHTLGYVARRAAKFALRTHRDSPRRPTTFAERISLFSASPSNKRRVHDCQPH